MPQIKSAKKRVAVTARRTAENRLHRSRSRTSLKKIRELVAAGKTTEAQAEVAQAQSYLDKAGKVRAFHPNATARYKSRLIAELKKAGVKGATPKRAVPEVAKKAPAKKAAPKKTAAKKPVAKKSAAKKK